ncbi:hypothetical protein HER39_12650, partial [Arthrobacter deserti]|nr:hypothetical protein [Arthrobacter deserti]
APIGETVLGETTVPPTVPVEPVTTTSGSTATSGGTAPAAKEEAKEVGREGVAAGQHVAQTAKEEAGHVAQEAKYQVKNLASQVGDNVRGQASSQQQRAATGLRSFSEGLSSMANGQPQSGPAMDLVNQAAERVNGIASWLENREPADVLDEVRSFARRRPGAVLAIAAGAGLLAGRLARGMAAGAGGGGGTNAPRLTGAVPPQPTYVPETAGTYGAGTTGTTETYGTTGTGAYGTTGTGAYGTTGTGAYGTTGTGAYGTTGTGATGAAEAGTYPADPGVIQPPVRPAGTEPTTQPPRTPSEQTLDEGG